MFEPRGAGVAIADRLLLAATDLTLGGGRMHGLIGHNGPGKSTHAAGSSLPGCRAPPTI